MRTLCILNTQQPGRSFPGGSVGKESACDAGDPGLIPGSGRSPGKGHGSPLQYSCLARSINRGAWKATVHGGHKESEVTEQLSLTNSTMLKKLLLNV